MSEVFLEAKEIVKLYGAGSHLFGRKKAQPFKALDGVSLTLYRGETLGLVGESGCGKSTLGKCLLRAIPPSGGQILLRGRDGEMTDFTAMTEKEVRKIRSRMQMIFQDPFNSLNPNMTIRDLIGEPLLFMGNYSRSEIDREVSRLMEAVGLDSRYLGRYPHAFSGGQRQRICIARAIATRPDFIVCDEAVSALDVSVRAQIINLLMDLQEEMGMAYLFISHDLSVVRHISNRVAVLYAGRIVESGNTEDLFEHTAHPYTRLLLDSAPKMDPGRKRREEEQEERQQKRTAEPGEKSDLTPVKEAVLKLGGKSTEAVAVVDLELAEELSLDQRSDGCAFYPRCPHRLERCRNEVPKMEELESGHCAACFLIS